MYLTSKTGKHNGYHGKHHAYHEALLPTMSQKRLPLTIQHFLLKIDIFTSKTGKHDAYHGKHPAYNGKHPAYHEALPRK